MFQIINYIVIFPLLGFIILSVFGSSLKNKTISVIGIGSVGVSALITILTGIFFIISNETQVTVQIGRWFYVKDLQVDFAFRLDSLSLLFVFVITFVGFLIHLYSIEYMRGEAGYARFFAYMNLFVFSMLILVLADNIVFLYLGWEGVGLCSFLLIGFWFKEPENMAAARKAFIITRIGDTALAIGMFIMFYQFNSLNIQEISDKSSFILGNNPKIATVIALLLLCGALGKSAQLPFQTWLPDAMAGPTPVSALIHAATMVTAGVYLIARTHVIFSFSPLAMAIIAIIGSATLVIAGISALMQDDIKKVLAYSTVSQIGYMFLALGVGAWSAAIFHFFIHAFFKALLFLAAGSVIIALHHEQNMFRMGGLIKKMPITFITFLVGSASLAALPIITAGFYSKDQILWFAFSSVNGNLYLWIAGVTGAFITAAYSFRMLFITFFGKTKTEIHQYPGKIIEIPLIILAVFSIGAGFIELPENIGHIRIVSGLLHQVLPKPEIVHFEKFTETNLQLFTGTLVIVAVLLAYLLYRIETTRAQDKKQSSVYLFFQHGWGFDSLYDTLIVKPYIFLAKINKDDFFDFAFKGIAVLNVKLNSLLSLVQTGNTRWYVMGISVGAVLIILTILIG